MTTAAGGITAKDARRIARKHYVDSARVHARRAIDAATRAGIVRVVDSTERRAVGFGLLPSDEPMWLLYVPWGDGLDGQMLRSSRVIAVSKVDGRVVYDGSAHDEG